LPSCLWRAGPAPAVAWTVRAGPRRRDDEQAMPSRGGPSSSVSRTSSGPALRAAWPPRGPAARQDPGHQRGDPDGSAAVAEARLPSCAAECGARRRGLARWSPGLLCAKDAQAMMLLDPMKVSAIGSSTGFGRTP